MIFVILCWLTYTTVAMRPRSRCYVADSIVHHGSDKNMLWKGRRSFPSFGFPSRGYNKSWLMFVTSYGSTAALQFAHANTDGRCQFLTKQDSSSVLALTEPRNCHFRKINKNTMFSTSMGSLSSKRYINFGPFSSSPSSPFIAYRGKKLILTSSKRVRHMSWWRININLLEQCDI